MILTCGAAAAPRAGGGVFSTFLLICALGSERGVEGDGGAAREVLEAIKVRPPPIKRAASAAIALWSDAIMAPT